MLKWAVQAGLPIVTVETGDTLNAPLVVAHVTGKQVTQIDLRKSKIEDVLEDFNGETHVALVLKPEHMNGYVTDMYKTAIKKETTVIILNLPEKASHELIFRAGVLPTPKELVSERLGKIMTKELIAELLPALGGLTLREVGEVIRLTQARDGDNTFKGVMQTRRALFSGERGVTLVDPNMELYWPMPALSKFASANKAFFHEATDHRLRPRGLLAAGLPGTGKTQGAKYLANQWGVPLYRMDATVQSKWVGESEANLARALSQVAQEEPCVFLIDEIEKLFGGSSDGESHGTIRRMLGSLLWFLQENRARVFTFMTCNNDKIIPPELYREGRIDLRLEFKGLEINEALKFAEALVDTFEFDADKLDPYTKVKDMLSKDYATPQTWGKAVPGMAEIRSHAHVTKLVTDAMKLTFLQAQEGK